MSTDNRALTGRALVKNFGNVHALAGVDIDIPSGQALAIMGPSGSGKSTLLHCLSGILTPTSGEICLGGKNVSGLPDKSRSRLRLKHFGFVFQDGQLVPELPANENVALPLMLSDAPRRTAISAADDWLRRLGLEDEANRRPGEMSGGQAQRVGVARALAADPEVLLMDEPFGALDPIVRAELQRELKEIQRALGTTILFVTHDVDEAFTLGDQVAVLSAGGRIEQVGTPTELLSFPASPFVAEFVGASRAARPVRVAGPGGLVVDDAGTPVGTLTTDEAGERP